MSDLSLVPVDHLPDFSDVSLIPVDHDPFSSDRTTQQVQIQQAQAPPESPVRQQPMGAYSHASLAPSLNDIPKADYPYWPNSSKTGSTQQQFSMASHAAYSKCVDKCLHLLASP